MHSLSCQFPSTLLVPKRRPIPVSSRVSIRPPPPDFNYTTISTLLEDSKSAALSVNPSLIDLVEDGSLVVIKKPRFGPVPVWRREFVEPEEIWLVGTSHVAERSGLDVDRVVKGVRPDNVVVELCRSRVQSWNNVRIRGS